MNRKEFLSASLGGIAAMGLKVPPNARAQRQQPPPTFFQLAVFTQTETLIRWTFPFDTWEFGNREAYDTAWWWFLDGGSPAYPDPRAIKLIVRQYGQTYTKINDRNGNQPSTDFRPVPYEDVFPEPDLSHEITDAIVFIRRDPGNPKVPVVIGGFSPKLDDLRDPDIHWWYQGGGVLVATYGGDTILRLWIQSARNDVSWLSPL